ncbi:related to RIM2 - Protein of the mitochondrial carrier family (MCF) [Melanopsichium pennsylvanicum]|uniref:Related to RIM2 - Protein of the mitochondrial carrier family (MCF) n=2 Tax=Melanopsichium pennsylvanicum TaxID=63383 RepID=A0AAJ5C6G8_9BASI|nr:related to RIM2-Protein of the mitochondrial carrier family (MCF) [Melanopsichium pennsylvanicum 4]SNX85832.1 related to RIM2 - Protein of the mitochondrial carrier family (MCF) [Melanopsichium pennsylvanicum]
MPYLGTVSPGEGETETTSAVLPSARIQSSTPLSIPQLQKLADSGDAGAQVDLGSIEAQQAASSSSSQTLVKGEKKLIPPKGWLHFVAGGAGGMCGAIITSPLDVVKTRLQSDLYRQRVGNKRNAAAVVATAAATPDKGGVLQHARRLAYHFVETGYLLKEISTTEGPRALFRGLGPTLVGVIPARSINFYTYGNGKKLIADRFNGGAETTLVHLSAAAFAGLVTATATNPIWVVKTRLQLDSRRHETTKPSTLSQSCSASTTTGRPSPPSPPTRTGKVHFCTTAIISSKKTLGAFGEPAFFHASKATSGSSMSSAQMTLHIIRKEGIKGLYRGMSASYLGVAEGTIQWVLYERLKKMGADESNSVSSNQNGSAVGSKLSSMVGAAGMAKLVASLITYPHEVVRTRLRQQVEPGKRAKYVGLVQTIKLVYREQGFAALYGGLSAHLLRVVPNAVVMFSIYELTLRFGSKVE